MRNVLFRRVGRVPVLTIAVSALAMGIGGGLILQTQMTPHTPSAANAPVPSFVTPTKLLVTPTPRRLAPSDTPPVATATPPSVTPIPTATPVLGLMLAVSPQSENVVCDNHHYLPITIRNSGNTAVGWATQTSAYATYPDNSGNAGNSLLAPGLSQQTVPDGVATTGIVWTITVAQENPDGSLGPVAAVATITCA